jgi:hypothetical protein
MVIKMKNIFVIIGGALLGMSLIAPNTSADTVVLTQNAYSFSVGGEFNTVTSQDFLGDYSSLDILNNGLGNGFQTFCVESTVDFNPGDTYTYVLSDVDSSGRQLSEGAAFLYWEFGKGILPGYDYADAATRNTDAGILQAAIWWFQDQTILSGYPSPTNNAYYEYAVGALGLSSADSANNGLLPVDVLQMWDANNNPAQNQLVLVPTAPDNCAAAELLGIGLAGLALISRRKRAC